MTEILSFPGLGVTMEINRVALQIGGLTIYWYGIIAATGLLLGVMYAVKRAPEFGIKADDIIDIFLYGTVGGIVGARAYFVIFSWDMFKDDLLSIFAIWNGGIAIYGGIIGAFLVGIFIAKKRKIKVLPIADIALSSFLLGQSIGRWGNFINIEAFGSNTTLPWGMTSSSIVNYLIRHKAQLGELGVNIDPTMPVHPTFFYESLWCIIGFMIVVSFTKKRRFDGEITLFYCGWYGAGRFVIEGLRTDSLMLGNIRVSQILSGVVAVSAVLIWLYIRNKIRKANNSEYMLPYGHTKEYKDKLIEGILDVSSGDEKLTQTILGGLDMDALAKEVKEQISQEEIVMDQEEIVENAKENNETKE